MNEVKDDTSSSKLTSFDAFALIILGSIGFIIRFWVIHHPDGPAFDEVHFGNFTNWYTMSQFYFDIHPVLAKLMMFYAANLSEYNGLIRFHSIGHYADQSYIQLRLTPAFFSALCCPLVYLAVRFSGFGCLAGITSSILLICDTSLGTEGRFILSDGILHFFCCLHLAIVSYTFSIYNSKNYQNIQNSSNKSHQKIKISRNKFNFYHFLNGLSLGAACSCKNTAWGLMAFDAYIYIIEFMPLINFGFLDYLFDVFIYGMTLFFLVLFVYISTFIIHFIILPFEGQGIGYLTPPMKQQLIPNRQANCSLWYRRIAGPSMIYRTVKVSLIMHHGNMGIKTFHGSQSRPNNWPFLTGIDVGFWGGGGQEIRCHGNVFSYYFAFAGVVFCCLPIIFNFFRSPLSFLRNFFYARNWSDIHKKLVAFRFAFGWMVSYFPLFLVPRTLYLYHYLIPLMIGCCAYGASLDLIIRSPRTRGIVAFVTWALAIFGFYLWMPLVYGKYMHDRSVMFWNDNWLHGDEQYKLARGLNAKKKS